MNFIHEPTDLSRLIKRYRKNKGFTQVSLAKIMGVAEHTVQRWEVGVQAPTRNLIKLTKALKLTNDETTDLIKLASKTQGAVI